MLELDSLRQEISLCIMFGLNQASITLTNHLTEWFIKFLLINNQAITNHRHTDKPNNVILNLDEYFSSGVKDYMSKDMSQTIGKAKSLGLLTKDEWKKLDKIREDYRNAFGHADSLKIFKDSKINSLRFSLDKNHFSKPHSVKISDLPIIHGVMKVQFAETHAIEYFRFIDNLIREKLLKLLPSSKKMNGLT